jgi:predicted kinase
MEVVVFIGLQGAGKSTFFRTYFAGTHVHISKDNFRSANNRERRQQKLLRDALEQGLSVVIDNTNPSVTTRLPLLQTAKEFGARIIGYYFDSTLADCLKRNQQREGVARVPDIALFVTNKQIEPPSHAEGFDQLFTVRIVEQGQFAVAERDETLR